MSNNPIDPNEEVIIPRCRDEQGRWYYEARLTHREDTRNKVCMVSTKVPIPVVFVPGVMGSNLRDKESGDSVWRPPNVGLNLCDILVAIVAVVTWGFRDAKERQKLLKPHLVEVDNRGSIDTGDSGLSEKTARDRGWGSVMRSSYNPPMALFEQQLNHIFCKRKPGRDCELQPWWRNEGMREPADYGEELGQAEALDESQLLKANCYQFDFWCAGYNWLQPNLQSAADVRDYIDNTVLAHYCECGQVSAEQLRRMKVIIVTHSMGGLVARALTQLLGYQRVLGVVHGVQPVSGAPAIYHHMRAGYEGAEQIVLGSNAGEVTAVVANAPGPLELVPSAEHRNGRPWLFARDANGRVLHEGKGENRRRRAYPSEIQGSANDLSRNQQKIEIDPYEEIYKSSAWYGLVPEQNTQYLDMSDEAKNKQQDPRESFRKLIDAIAKFHRQLPIDSYHPETYASYGADDSRHSWRDVSWVGDPARLDAGEALEDDGNGSYNGWFQSEFPEIRPNSEAWGPHDHHPDERQGSGGDGTVPTDSSQLPGKAGIEAGVKASFRHGNKGRGQYNREPGYDHQKSYQDERTQWATLYSIIKIAQLADWDRRHQESS